MTSRKYLSVVDTAKLIRAALKAAHPGVKFSVKSQKYAGGASINVRWTDGPSKSTVEKTTRLYSGATFDGMTDLKEYHDSVLVGADGEIEHVHFGADFVFADRDISEAEAARLLPVITEAIREEPSPLTYYRDVYLPGSDRVHQGDIHSLTMRLSEIQADAQLSA